MILLCVTDWVWLTLQVGAVVEVKSPAGTCQEAVINKLTDASWYTVGKKTVTLKYVSLDLTGSMQQNGKEKILRIEYQ